MQRRRGLAALLALPFASAAPLRAAEARRRITVYTAVEPEWLAVYRNAFAAVRPDIEITYVRASGGPICARLLAEKDRVQADAVLGVSAIALENLRAKGVLEPYAPHEIEKLNPKMVEKDNHRFGINAWGGSVCVNTDLLRKKGLAVPQSWADLLQPEFKDRIVMPNPRASSTGLMFLHGFVQGFGEEKGWEVIEKLHANMLFYAASGARPAAMAAQGEIPIGLSAAAFLKPFLKYKTPVTVVQPEEGNRLGCGSLCAAARLSASARSQSLSGLLCESCRRRNCGRFQRHCGTRRFQHRRGKTHCRAFFADGFCPCGKG